MQFTNAILIKSKINIKINTSLALASENRVHQKGRREDNRILAGFCHYDIIFCTSATVVFALRKWVYSAGCDTLIVRWIKQVTILTVTGHRALSVGHVTVEPIHFRLYVPDWTSGNRIKKTS